MVDKRKPKMTNEDMRLLLGLVKAGVDGSADPQLSPRQVTSADWATLGASARYHRLSGLLFEGIRKLGWDSSLPASTSGLLRTAYYTNLAHNLVLFDHAEKMIEGARGHGAPLVILKGAAFAGWLYSNPALRPMSDLDILVRPRDLDLLVPVARNLGYEWYDRTDHAVSLRHSETLTYLELHTSLTTCPDYLGIDTEDLLAHSAAAALWAEPARTLAPEDHILHLCLHGSFQHGLRQPAINACDVHLLSMLPETDWERLSRLCSPPRLAPLVYGGLLLCHRVFPNEKIRLALEALAPRIPRRLRTWLNGLESARFLAPSLDSVSGSPWSRVLWTPGLKDVFALARETLSPREGERPGPRRWPSIRRGLALASRQTMAPWCRNIFRTTVRTGG